jgi:hypothetical protein
MNSLTAYKLAKTYTDNKFAIATGADKIYGAYWNKGSSPVLTRTDDAIGLNAAVGVDGQYVSNDFDTAQIFREMGPITDALGNVFIRIPKFYIRKTDGVGFKTWQISKTQYPGFYLPWCFWDFTNAKELPYIDVGKYKATKSADNKLESKPNVYPYINDHIVNFRTYARNNNTGEMQGYQQLDIHVVDILRTLMIVEFATLNIQTIMKGYVIGQYTTTHLATVAENGVNRIIVANETAALYAVGQSISIGTSQGGNQIFYGRTITAIDVYDASNKAISFNGTPVNITVGNMLYNTGWKNGFSANIAASSGSVTSNADGLHPCIYRGIESPFGDVSQFTDGININAYQAWAAKNANDYASNVYASPYEQLGYLNINTNGYVKAMGFDSVHPYVEFPVDVVGSSSTTYYADSYNIGASQQIAVFGGSWDYDIVTGFSYWNMANTSSNFSIKIGGRLVRKAL